MMGSFPIVSVSHTLHILPPTDLEPEVTFSITSTEHVHPFNHWTHDWITDPVTAGVFAAQCLHDSAVQIKYISTQNSQKGVQKLLRYLWGCAFFPLRSDLVALHLALLLLLTAGIGRVTSFSLGLRRALLLDHLKQKDTGHRCGLDRHRCGSDRHRCGQTDTGAGQTDTGAGQTDTGAGQTDTGAGQRDTGVG